MSALDPHRIAELVEGAHHAPFDVLGLHALQAPEAPGRVVRAFLPWARSVWVEEAGRSTPMQRVHAAGLYEAEFDGREDWFAYRLRAEDWSGGQVEIEDPYRFLPVLDEERLWCFHRGEEIRAWQLLGARELEHGGVRGVVFAVWAPNARAVSVVGSFNGWDARVHPMRSRGGTGVFELFLPRVQGGDLYKFSILTHDGHRLEKADPYARAMELRPRSASVVVADSGYRWSDESWLRSRAQRHAPDQAMSIYEVHLGSWRRNPDPEHRRWQWLSYRELADQMLPYAADLGFTHVELMPVTEHPFDGSWGYQTLGYFAPTSRFGTPDDFRHFVDRAHALGLGVILDWVPAHFPADGHGLALFDGTHLYEHADPRLGQHPDWGTLVFNYGRNEVACFLLSSALYWIEEFHVDGLRVDAVASMLYLDYSRQEGQWIPNRYGGRENLEAIEFLRRCNGAVHTEHPGVLTFAEESTAWPGVTAPLDHGGLGFDLKWNMGWMNDTLEYVQLDPLFRRHRHDRLTFSLVYAFSERFLLPLSHDEVVHGKRSLLSKMPGADPERIATLRALYTYMWTHPGKKLLFMGGELGQWGEWNHEGSIEWHLFEDPRHAGIHALVRRLNALLREYAALRARDFTHEGFEWIDAQDADRSTIAYLRWNEDWTEAAAVVVNFTPVRWEGYRLGLPFDADWERVLDSGAPEFGGREAVAAGPWKPTDAPWQGRPCHIEFDLPPLTALVFIGKRERA